MKGFWKILMSFVLGGVLGWALGYLRIPMVDGGDSFWVGFVSSLAIVGFVIGLLYVWNKNALLMRLIGKGANAAEGPKAARSYTVVWILVAVFILVGGSLSSWMVYQQNQMLETQTQSQDHRIWQQSELIESIRKSSQVILMGNVLDNVDREVAAHPQGPLSDATIARVAALSYSLKPYASFAGDTLTRTRLSPERGQLLLALSLMKIDSASFAKIKQSAIFFQADLGDANLKGADLSGANLGEANLRGSDLSGANLCGAYMKEANLWGANMNNAQLSHANLNRADARWAQLKSADLRGANMNGMDLRSAQMQQANLNGATFNWAKATGAMLNGVTIVDVDMQGIIFERANLSQVDFSTSNLLLANLNEAILTGTELSDVRVDKDWVEKLGKWKIANAQELQAQYEVVPDTSGKYLASKFLLKKIGAGK